MSRIRKIKYLGMEDFGSLYGIIYRRIDPFGVISVNTVECTFKIEDGVVTPYLLSVDINGKRKAYEAENPVRVEAFNKSVPTIEANPPDLRVPYFPLDDMSAYRDFIIVMIDRVTCFSAYPWLVRTSSLCIL